jgi:hypothetical protein
LCVLVVHVHRNNGVCKLDHEKKSTEVTHFLSESFIKFEDLQDLIFTETAYCEESELHSKYDFLFVTVAICAQLLQLPPMVTSFFETTAKVSIVYMKEPAKPSSQKKFGFEDKSADVIFIVGPDKVKIPAHKAVLQG